MDGQSNNKNEKENKALPLVVQSSVDYGKLSEQAIGASLIKITVSRPISRLASPRHARRNCATTITSYGPLNDRCLHACAWGSWTEREKRKERLFIGATKLIMTTGTVNLIANNKRLYSPPPLLPYWFAWT